MPYSPKPTKKEVVTAFRTREILAAARKLMEQRGLEAVTMDEIAGAAGVAKGTIYLYFPSKDELIQELLSQVGENLRAALESIINTPQPPEEKLRQVVTWLLRHLERERVLFPVFLQELRQERSGEPGRGRRFHDLEEKIMAQLTGLFAEGIVQRQFIPANPRLLTFMLRGLVRSVGYYQMSEGQEEAVKEALPLLLTLLSSGLTPKPQAAAEVATP
ncbi:MAG: TetR/AcrR family transcriptional regulator [Deltaproteobacteria bacterium]|nr:TetR/AcrR family transcriptional regulator [Deltaproteobacteria bacterium]